MLLKVTEKILLDRNIMYSPIIHRIHSYCYCSLLLLLFTVYTFTVDCFTTVIITVVIWILIVLIELNNNINGQLTLRLGKLMKTSIFWVNLGRLRSRLTVPLQGSER